MTRAVREQPVDVPGRLSLGERLIVERAVWSLDYRLQDLPWRSRVSKRRELRQDLRVAAADVGARTAVERLGDLRRLAQEYLAAEYGDLSQRPHWNAAAAWLMISVAVMMLIDHVATSAFRAGVSAAGVHPNGVLAWGGVPHVLDNGTFTYRDGQVTRLGGAWTPWVYVVMLGGAVLVGRLWRAVPYVHRHRRSASVWLELSLIGLAVAGLLALFVFSQPSGKP